MVEPKARERPPTSRRLRLIYLVVVMGRHEVDAARVDIYLLAKRRVDHRRALYVPTRKPFTPGAVPPYLRVALPVKEVGRVMLVGIRCYSFAFFQALKIDRAEFAVVGKTGSIEIDTMLSTVRVAFLLERSYESDLSLDVPGGARKLYARRVDIEKLG